MIGCQQKHTAACFEIELQTYRHGYTDLQARSSLKASCVFHTIYTLYHLAITHCLPSDLDCNEGEVSCLNIKLHLKNSPPCHRCQSQTTSPSLTCQQGNESGCSMSPIHQPWQATFAWFRSDGVPVTAGGRAYFCWRWRNDCVCSAVKWLVSAVSFGWVLNCIKLPSSHKYSRGQI